MDVSVVVPVFNSQGSLKELFEKLNYTLTQLNLSFEVVFVDDCSKDSSWDVLLELKESHSDLVKLIRFSRNFGQHNATLCGLRYAKGDVALTIDDDLQQAPEDIVLLLDRMKQTNADLVYGVGGEHHSTFRKVGSSLYKKTAKYIDGKYGDGSSFRLISRSLLEKVVQHTNHFVLLEELLFWYTQNIEIVPVQHFPKKSGKSGYSPWKIFQLISDISLNYSDWPLKFMTYGGAVFSVISFLFGVYFIFKKVFLDVNIRGFTALIVAVFFSTSLLLLCFGIVGKYLNNIHTALSKKPMYSIKEAYL